MAPSFFLYGTQKDQIDEKFSAVALQKEVPHQHIERVERRKVLNLEEAPKGESEAKYVCFNILETTWRTDKSSSNISCRVFGPTSRVYNRVFGNFRILLIEWHISSGFRRRYNSS